MKYFCILAAILILSWGDVPAEGGASTQKTDDSHFVFRLPRGSRTLEPGDPSFRAFSDQSWFRLYARRFADLDRIFAITDDWTLVLLGLKVEPYRRRLKRPLSYDEFADEERIESYAEALAHQFESHGLSRPFVKGFVADEKAGVIRYISEFQTGEGIDAEEYYASILGSHEIVYLILFAAPPSKLEPFSASLFEQVVESFEFKPGYGYSARSDSGWAQRTWGEQSEILIKLSLLFLFVYSASHRGLESFLKPLFPSVFPMILIIIRVISIGPGVLMCLAFLKWVQL